MIPAVVGAVAIVRMVTTIRSVMTRSVRWWSSMLELRSSIRQHIKTSVRTASQTPIVGIQIRLVVCSIGGERVWG